MKPPKTVNPPIHVNTAHAWALRWTSPRRVRCRPTSVDAHLSDGGTVAFVDDASFALPAMKESQSPVGDAIRRAVRILQDAGEPVRPYAVSRLLARNDPFLYAFSSFAQVKQVLRGMGMEPQEEAWS